MTEGINTQGNEENLEKVRDLMEKAKTVNMGGNLTEAVKIDYVSQYGSEYKGTIIFKRPTMQDYMKMGAIKSQILGSSGVVNLRLVDETIKFMAQAVSVLSVVIVKAPDWLIRNGKVSVDHIVEPDVVYHIYDKYEEWEDSFRTPIQENVQGDSESTE